MKPLTMIPLKIYVAAPYTPDTCDIHDAARIAHKNTLTAIRIGIELIKKGHYPFIPHLSHFIHLESDEPLSRDYYCGADYVWLECCDALFYVASSKGADAELNFAIGRGMLIFKSLDEVQEVVI